MTVTENPAVYKELWMRVNILLLRFVKCLLFLLFGVAKKASDIRTYNGRIGTNVNVVVEILFR